MRKISIIDSGLSNIYNVCQAFKYIGMNVNVVNDIDDEINDHLVLPGVGSFRNGMSQLSLKKLITPIKNHINTGKPFLGICLGMQMMFEKSYEFGEHAGLGVIKGDIQKIPNIGKDHIKHKIPHIGWNKNIFINQNSSLLKNIIDGTATYFVHSYMANIQNLSDAIAVCDYNGIDIISIVQHNNSFGCQFHPEKSGENGLKLLSNFSDL
jgi:glutamine amidotransferase